MRAAPAEEGRAGTWWVLLAALSAFGALSAWRGADASWDERNYHLYAAYAALTGRLGFDLAPAQQQTYLSPLLDLLRAGLRGALPPTLFRAAAAVPHALAVTASYRIALLVAPGAGLWRCAAALLATLIGATGAAALPTLGTSMSDMPDGAFVLLAALLLMRAPQRAGAPTLALAGACLGAAAGLRLPAAPLCLGVLAAYAACAGSLWRARAGGLAILSLASLATLLAVAGPWWSVLEARYGNPLFPYFNDVFRAPAYPPIRLADARFLPRGAFQAVLYPFWWAFDQRPVVSELPLRDPRFAFAWCALALGTVVARSRRTAFLAVLFAVSHAAWAAQFGILRYLAPLELLTGAAMLAPMRRWGGPRATLTLVAVGATCAALTVFPDWGHVSPRGAAVHVEAPGFEPGSLVLLLDSAPMAYVAAFADPGARFAGADSNLIQPGQDSGLAREIDAAVRAHSGPLWGLEYPSDQPGVADRTLAYYGLVRAPGCAPVPSNLDGGAIIACRLLRAPG